MEIFRSGSLHRRASLFIMCLRSRRRQGMIHGSHCRAGRAKVACVETRWPHVACVDEQLWLLRMVLVVRVVTRTVLRHLCSARMAKAMMRSLASFVKNT